MNYKILTLPFVAVFLIWFIFWLELKIGGNFSQFGIYPQDIKGLFGIFLSPFIHGNLEHLYNNTIPLFVLLLLMQYFYKRQTYIVIFFGIVFSGLVTWIIGRPSFHIGSSGVIYTLVSFIFFKGVLVKNYRLSALSFVVVFLYGGMVWYIFPEVHQGVSWEGHLGGFLGGLILALVISTPEAYSSPYQYDWEHPEFNRYKDPFMKHFDEKGNFVTDPHRHTTAGQPVKIHYVYKSSEDDSESL